MTSLTNKSCFLFCFFATVTGTIFSRIPRHNTSLHVVLAKVLCFGVRKMTSDPCLVGKVTKFGLSAVGECNILIVLMHAHFKLGTGVTTQVAANHMTPMSIGQSSRSQGHLKYTGKIIIQYHLPISAVTWERNRCGRKLLSRQRWLPIATRPTTNII